MDPTAEFAQLQLGFVDHTQQRYEVIRPLILFADRTAVQRARETQTHPDTVRTLQRRFQRQGMLGLLPSAVEVVHRRRASPIPDAVRQEIDRLKALYDGFHYRESASATRSGILSHPSGPLPGPPPGGQTLLSRLGEGQHQPVPEGLPSHGQRLDHAL